MAWAKYLRVRSLSALPGDRASDERRQLPGDRFRILSRELDQLLRQFRLPNDVRADAELLIESARTKGALHALRGEQPFANGRNPVLHALRPRYRGLLGELFEPVVELLGLVLRVGEVGIAI